MLRRVEEQWGTVITVDVRDDVRSGALDEVFAWFRRVDELFSTWRDDSEIMLLANGTLTVADVSDEVRTVLERCEAAREATSGAFDIRATSALPEPHGPGWSPIDPSGLVKGWAVDRAGDDLRRAGAERFTINAGGDVTVRGVPSPGALWRVGVQHPWERDKTAATVEVTDTGVATSGRYERGNHVVDPRTGCPARGLASVTVVADDLAWADAAATAAVALGRDGLEWLASRNDLEALAITDDAEVFTTPGFSRFRV